ncbi:MAG: phosphonate C-P lyase system protein PhnG [Sneathiella sp.]
MSVPALTPDQVQRKSRMEILARSNSDELAHYWQEQVSHPSYSHLREPEIGLVMVRARSGGKGSRFNLGEMTITRCSVVLEDGTIGHGYVKGRDRRHAELAALFDARFQQDDTSATFLTHIENRLTSDRAVQSAKSAATKVEFYTMVRGED